ncbi:YkvA family protein [Pseudomonas sp. KCJK8993]|uniref:YkvA family protein n=1 Tax=Pseudomonas sp. KCJK8993 TaxID=3344565 RepID=UPI0039068D73
MKAPWNFARFLPLAARLLGRGRLPTLLFAVASKGVFQGERLGKVKEDLRLLQALCLAYWRGEYRAISPKALLSVVAGLMYFLSPLDAIPDFLPLFGMLDDIAVLAWLMKTLGDELDAFRAWRNRQTPEKLAVVERLPDTAEQLRLEGAGKPSGNGPVT